MMWSRCVLLALMLLLVGCESDEAGAEARSIAYLRGLYRGYPVTLHEEFVVEGEVISSDRGGEFHHQLVVQDHTGGIVFSIDCDNLYALYSVGDRVRVRCLGLRLGSYGRALRLGCGSADGREVSAMSEAEWRERSESVGHSERLTTTHVEIGTIEPRNLSSWVRVEGVRFVEAGQVWAPEGESTTRHLVSIAEPCDTLRVRLSGYSDFRQERIPEGRCTVEGVLDYFSDSYQLVLHSMDGVLTDNEK